MTYKKTFPGGALVILEEEKFLIQISSTMFKN